MARFRVYYDGKCRLCSREIDYYRRKAGAGQLDWVDISQLGFDAKAEGLDPNEVIRVFHVRDESARLVTGVDAFIEIWRRLPELEPWVRVSRLPGVKALMRGGYHFFVRIRPYLPRHKDECSDGYCDRS